MLVSGMGSGWLGCEHQNYLLRPAEAGRASDRGPWRGHSSRVAFPALSPGGCGSGSGSGGEIWERSSSESTSAALPLRTDLPFGSSGATAKNPLGRVLRPLLA